MFTFDHQSFALAQTLWREEVPSRNAAFKAFQDKKFRQVAGRVRYLKHLAEDLDSRAVEASLNDQNSRLCIRYKIDKGERQAFLNAYDWALVQHDPRFKAVANCAKKLRPLMRV